MEPEYQGTKTLQPFSPRWTDPELLEKTLIGRRELVDKLEQLVLEGAGGPNKYQRLIIGPRGSGKTHVLKVLHTRLWRNAGLKDRVLIVYLLEDELGVASFLDFLVRLLKAIAAWYPENAELAKGLDELYDLPASAKQRRAVELLLQAAAGRDLLIIVENLGVTFDATHGFGRKGQQALRDLVQQHPRFMIFASAQALLDGISESNAPFYQFFTITRLKKLSYEEALELLATVAVAYGSSGIAKFLGTAEGRSRVRAIYEFTGGNHRLLVTFYDFLSADSVARISDAFIEALKPLKPYYQEQMRALSAQQQKIVQYLSLERTPRTVKEIARGCLATSNTVSSQLKALLEKGFVERVQQGRESYYEVSETLFRICCEADLDHQGAPIRLFVDFLGNFYTAQELETRARGFHLLARTVSGDAPSHESEAALYRSALLQYHRRGLDAFPEEANAPDEWKSFFGSLSERQAYDEIISFARRLGDSKDPAIALVEADAYVHRGNLADACAVLRKEIGKKPEDPNLHAKLGSLLGNAKDLPGAEACFRRALELDQSNKYARRMLAAVLVQAGRNAEALTEFEAVTSGTEEMNAADLAVLGFLQETLGHTTEAEELRHRALAADPDNLDVRLVVANTLGWAGRSEEALTQFEAVTALDSTNAGAHAMAGDVLASLGRLAEAELRFRSALVIEEENPTALLGLTRLLNRTGRPREALAHLQRLLQMDGDRAQVQHEMGISHRALGEWDSAAASFRRAVDLEPTEEATAALAEILNRQQRFSEAEPLVRDAIEKWPNSARLRLDLGRILMDTDRPREFLEQLLVARQLEPPRAIHFMMGGVAAFMDGDLVEAEKELRKALQLDEKSAPVWRCLGLFMIETGRQADATEYLQTAASLSPNDPDIWSELGGAWNAAGNLEKAEAAFRRALELNSPTAARELARLLVVANRVTEAETLLREAIEREPANTRARDDLARILINLHRPAEALDQLLAIEKLEPGSARHSLRAGLAALMAGDLVTAERQLRAAIDLDQTISEAWIGLGRALSAAGRLAEAIELLGNAPEEAGRARILTGRGDLQAEVGNLSEAVADYEAALKLDGSNTETLFSLAGVLLTQGRVGDAAENATRAIETQPGGEDLVENLGSNLDALFASCTRSQMATYLEPVLEALNRQGRLAAFEQALSLAAFELLRQNESVSEDRFADAIWALENLVAGRMNVSVAVQFLSVGRDYFKHQDRKALMNLSREERALFTKELGIDANA